MTSKKLLYPAFFIILNLLVHFIPFERASIAPDDYASLIHFENTAISQIPAYILNHSDRPLNHAVLALQSKLIGDNSIFALSALFFSTIFVLLGIFYLLNLLFNNRTTALIGSIIFCLLPHKIETYHTLIFFNINMAIGIYVLSLIFFIAFFRNSKMIHLFFSALFYAIGIFWYEVGFFLPLVMAGYIILYNRKFIKYLSYFAAIAAIYAIYRLTGAFGMADSNALSHQIGISTLPILDLFHQYFGRYAARIAIYGAYKFFSIENPWLAIVIFSDILLLVFLNLFLKARKIISVDKKLIVFAGIGFAAFLTPNLLSGGGVAGRHLVLPSIAATIFGLWLLAKLKRIWRPVFLTFAAVTLIICQGNAWTQVVACRINRAVYETMKEKKTELMRADNIIIDTGSFTDNIPFTFVQRDFNVLNTYYGAQAFEDWGLRSMLRLIIEDDKERNIYIATESPQFKEEILEFAISKEEGYRSISKVVKRISLDKTVIIDFKTVFGEDFNNGKRNVRK